MQKNSFVLQTRLNAIVTKLSDKQAGILFKSILNYAENGIKANFEDGMVDVVFEMVRQDIDYNNRKYEETCVRNSSNGKKGGAPKGNHNAQKQPKTTDRLKNNPKQPKTTENKHNDVDNDVDVDVDNDVDNDVVVSKPNQQKRFVKPTVAEIEAYCKEKGYHNINAEYYYNYNEARGWMLGKNHMKNWKANLATWHTMGKKNNIPPSEPVKTSADRDREYREGMEKLKKEFEEQYGHPF